MKRFSSFAAIIAVITSAFAAGKIPALPFTAFETYPDCAVEAICDGNLDNSFSALSGSYAWAALDLGAPHVVDSIRFAPSPEGECLLGMFQGANNEDFSDAIPLVLITETPLSGTLNALNVSCSRGVRYIRYVGPSGSHSQIAEFEAYGVPGEGDDSALRQITALPTVVVNTVESEEPYDKEHDIKANIVIISEHGAHVLDKPGSIRQRGNTSRAFPKKPWRIKFDKKQNVLDAPAKAKKWTLINNYSDKSLMRNLVAFETARKFGMEYVPYCRPVDVVLNGEYKGCYQLCDQVEVNEHRVNIDEMEAGDNEGDALTGGYLLEIDGHAYEEPAWFVTERFGMPVTIKSPDDDVITPEQKAYIKEVFDTLEANLTSGDDYDCTDPETGYRRLFDTGSFIRHMLVNEVAGNPDTYWSTYMVKRRGDDKIHTGPVWDFDLGFGNDYRVFPVSEKSGNGFLWDSGYASYPEDGVRDFAQCILIKDPTTAAEIRDIWTEARDNGFSAEWLRSRVDFWAAELEDPQRLNFMRWPILSEKVQFNPRVAGSYAQEIEWLREYMDAQMAHLEAVILRAPSDEPGSGTGIDTMPSGVSDGTSLPLYDIFGRRVGKPGHGVYVRSDRRKIIL